MKTWVRKTLSVGVLSAGALLFTGTAASADAGQWSVDNNGIANGTQVSVPVQIPVNVCGNGVGVLGIGLGLSGACTNGAADNISLTPNRSWHESAAAGAVTESTRTTESAKVTEDATQVSAGNDGILNGTQVYVPVQVPINICGNGVGVLGIGAGLSGLCANGAANNVSSGGHHGRGDGQESARAEDATQVSAGNDGILNGTQVYVPVQIPVNVCGNGVGVLGIGAGISGACTNGAVNNVSSDDRDHHGHHGHKGHDGHWNNGRQGGDEGHDGYYRGQEGATAPEALPVVGQVTQFVPLLSDAPLVGSGSLPLASVAKTSHANIGGIDPMQLLGQTAGN